jgi:hypothetical protein
MVLFSVTDRFASSRPVPRIRRHDVWGIECIDPRFLDLGTSWRRVVSFTDRPLYPRYPLDWRLGGPQCRPGRLREEKILDPTGYSNSDPSVVLVLRTHYGSLRPPSEKHS